MRRPDGLSIVELLLGFTLIAVVALLVVTQVRAARERSVIAALESDLLSFAVAQESYYYDNGVYAADATQIINRGFRVTPQSSIVVNEATEDGWAATASHGGTTVRCYIFIPGASPIGVASEPGVVRCG